MGEGENIGVRKMGKDMKKIEAWKGDGGMRKRDSRSGRKGGREKLVRKRKEKGSWGEKARREKGEGMEKGGVEKVWQN